MNVERTLKDLSNDQTFMVCVLYQKIYPDLAQNIRLFTVQGVSFCCMYCTYYRSLLVEISVFLKII